jgi:hypothetical protein
VFPKVFPTAISEGTVVATSRKDSAVNPRLASFVSLVCAAALALPAAALADPMPAGTYDAQVTGGSVQLGGLTLPVPPSPAVPVTIGTSPLTASVANQTFGPLTIVSASATLDPASGNASVSGSLIFDAVVGPMAIPCMLGSPGSPVEFTLDTAHGSPWNAATGAITIAGAIPPLLPTCVPPLGGEIATILGEGGTATVNATLIRRADNPPAPSSDTPTQTTAPLKATPKRTVHKRKLRKHRRHHHLRHTAKAAR